MEPPRSLANFWLKFLTISYGHADLAPNILIDPPSHLDSPTSDSKMFLPVSFFFLASFALAQNPSPTIPASAAAASASIFTALAPCGVNVFQYEGREAEDDVPVAKVCSGCTRGQWLRSELYQVFMFTFVVFYVSEEKKNMTRPSHSQKKLSMFQR